MTASLTPPEAQAVDRAGFFLPAWKQWLSALFRAQRISRTFVWNPGPVDPNSTSAQAITIERLTPDMDVLVTKPTYTAGLIVAGAFVSGPDQLTIMFANVTGGLVDPPTEVWRLLAWRR